MNSNFAPPPTFAEPVTVDEITKKARFNPIWLKWFLDLGYFLTNAGAASGTVNHSTTSDLQGGTTGQYYHLTQAEHTDVGTLTDGSNADSLHSHDHNETTGLQGGVAGEYYHLTAAEHSAIMKKDATAPSNISVGASPYVYQASSTTAEDIIVNGGTVSTIQFSRDGSTYYTIGLIGGMFHLSPSDYLKVTYSATPTMTKVPRWTTL